MSGHLAVELLSCYMDEETTPAQLRLVEGHLNDCTDCRQTLAGLRAVAAGVRRLEAVAPPPALAAAVERRVRLASLEQPSSFRLEESLRRWTGQPVLAPAFAIVMALGSILYLFAFGVEKGGRATTRLVVAAAPSEQESDSLGRRNELRTESEAPASKTNLDRLRAVEGSAKPEAKESPVSVGERTPTAPELVLPASAVPTTVASASPVASAGAGEGRPADQRQEPTSALEEILAENTENAESAESADATDRPARVEAAESSAAAAAAEVAGSSAAADGVLVVERPALVQPEWKALQEDAEAEGDQIGKAVPGRWLAGRTFVKEADVWVEVGLEGEPASEVVDLRSGPIGLSASSGSGGLEGELGAFRDLERVRLRVDGRVVEVIYPEARPEARPEAGPAPRP